MKDYTQIKYKERVTIETLLSEKRSNRYIASFLGRSPNTIGLEIKNGGGRYCYKADKSEQRRRNQRKLSKRKVLKVCKDKDIEMYVRRQIRLGWSPERIAGYLSRKNYDISTKAIYTYIYHYKLDHYLFWRINKKKSESISSTTFVKDTRKYIEERPSVKTKGHYEADFIVSGKSKTCLLVVVDKITRKVGILKLKDRKKITICNAIKRKTQNPKSITIDNDIVFQKWKDMENIIKTKIYFTHPYHSYEKGQVENTNRWIRVFFPKHISFDTVSHQKVARVEHYLNTIPRKVINFKSALEYEKEVS